MTVMPELDLELCNGCGLCIIACHGGGVVRDGEKATIIETSACDYCGVCEAVCPVDAIHCSYSIVPEAE
ncbi:MAG: 4Fe-4S binding protein [Chloroflexi bacterium]|nr:4Fe-4S binding protein [Chloroflexota bacterium]